MISRFGFPGYGLHLSYPFSGSANPYLSILHNRRGAHEERECQFVADIIFRVEAYSRITRGILPSSDCNFFTQAFAAGVLNQ